MTSDTNWIVTLDQTIANGLGYRLPGAPVALLYRTANDAGVSDTYVAPLHAWVAELGRLSTLIQMLSVYSDSTSYMLVERYSAAMVSIFNGRVEE